MLKSIIDLLLGVGKGWIGSGVRLLLGIASGWLAAKGVDVDAGTILSIENGLIGLGLAVLAYIGSLLNNKVVS